MGMVAVGELLPEASSWAGGLAGNGALVAVLAYLLVKTDKRLEMMEKAVDRHSRTILVAALAMESPPHIKRKIQGLLEEVEQVQKRQEKE